MAANWAHWMQADSDEPAYFEVFEAWVNKYVSNWASCDTLCNDAVGSFIVKYPKYLERLKGWTASPNRWARRAAAVSLIVPARGGEFLADIFEIADLLLLDKDDLVQKGYGWMLKRRAANISRRSSSSCSSAGRRCREPRCAMPSRKCPRS